MKKIFLFLFITLFSFPSIFAADIEDDSIIKELDKNNVKQLDFDFKLKSFETCEDFSTVMEKYIKNYWKNNKNMYRWGWIMYDTMLKWDFALEESSDDSVQEKSVSTPESTNWWSTDFSKTNTQVDWVDESDIVKTDGKYIYYYNEKDKSIYVVKVWELEIIKKIKIPNNFYSPILYIWENRLTIVSSWYSNVDYTNKWYWINRNSKTYTIIFDTTDIQNPKLVKLYISDWDLVNSRKIGDYLYLISNNSFSIPYYTFKEEDDIKVEANNITPKSIELTKTSDTTKQNLEIKGKKLSYNLKAWNIAKCNEIEYVLPDEETMWKFNFSPSYNIISIINTKDVWNDIKTKVIAWDNAEIYMSLENLYLTSNIYKSYNYSCPAFARCFMPWYPMWQNTIVHKINVNWNVLKYQDSTMIPWSPLTQYSMDEYEKNFRIITKTNNWSWDWSERHSDLYILDKDLKLKWSLTNLWSWEDFKSSRYIWNKLFLVTFKQIDPLFAIDLTDTSNPKILWELKIPGYSTYLHPYDENHLIGLGYDTKENQWWGTVNNWVKIDLYEINYDKKCSDTNLSEDEVKKCASWDYKWIIVKQKSSLTLWENWSYSEALDNPRMFMWKQSEKLLFLPVTLYKNSSTDVYRNIDFFQWLVTVKIDKIEWIKEKFRLSHIDTTGLEKERTEECSKYTKDNTEEKCVKLIGWWEYCQAVDYTYVPQYCYADSTIWEYLASKSWNYQNSFIKRALWVWNNTYAISDNKITSSNMTTWVNVSSIEMK